MPLTVAIVLFPEVEVPDFAGPCEVFTTASRVHRRRVPGAELAHASARPMDVPWSERP